MLCSAMLCALCSVLCAPEKERKSEREVCLSICLAGWEGARAPSPLLKAAWGFPPSNTAQSAQHRAHCTQLRAHRAQLKAKREIEKDKEKENERSVCLSVWLAVWLAGSVCLSVCPAGWLCYAMLCHALCAVLCAPWSVLSDQCSVLCAPAREREREQRMVKITRKRGISVCLSGWLALSVCLSGWLAGWLGWRGEREREREREVPGRLPPC